MTSILYSIILLGAVQGLIVSALLAATARRDAVSAQSKRLLAILILLPALACLNLYLLALPVLQNTPLGNLLNAIVPLVIIMPVGPLIYFYVRSCIEPDFRLTRKHRPHFYSIAIDLFQHAAAILFLIALITGVVKPDGHGFGTFFDYYNQYADIPRWLSLVIYLRFGFRYLDRMGKGGHDAWPRSLLRAFTIFSFVWLASLIPYEIPRTSDSFISRFDWYPLYLPLVVLIYWLGIKGYFVVYRFAPAKIPVTRPSIAPEQLAPALRALDRAMEEDKIWLDPGLNLGLLARHCDLMPKALSALLNQHLQKTFNEYINEYRIAAVKLRLLQPESRELTIAGLAYECGFNSLPTFQRAFKSITGLTPKEFLQKSAHSLEERKKTDQIRI